jgi:hypothetical protein
MTANAASILAHLDAVAAERQARRNDVPLGRRVLALKAYQQTRFARTHADMLAHPRYGAAARFFLEDLYGPHDFAERDAQFARVVPSITRLFPQEIVRTVDALGELHALSEQLDTQLASHLPNSPWGRVEYLRAWQAMGQHEARQHQLNLVLALGRRLDRFTRNRLLRQTLRMMRSPARAAGLAALQAFLERGFDTFAAMKGAEPFLDAVEQREHAAIQRYFETDAVALATSGRMDIDDPIGQLP